MIFFIIKKTFNSIYSYSSYDSMSCSDKICTDFASCNYKYFSVSSFKPIPSKTVIYNEFHNYSSDSLLSLDCYAAYADNTKSTKALMLFIVGMKSIGLVASYIKEIDDIFRSLKTTP